MGDARRRRLLAAAVHVDATPIRFDAAIPAELLERLTWRNRRGATRVMKHVVEGRLKSAVSLQGGLYRLTDESATQLAELVDVNDSQSAPVR